MRIFTLWLEKNGFGGYDITEIDNEIILNFFDYIIKIRNLDKVTVTTYKIKIKASGGNKNGGKNRSCNRNCGELRK